MKVMISESSITGLIWRRQQEDTEQPEPQRSFLVKTSANLHELVDHMVSMAAFDKQLIGRETSNAEKQVLKELGYDVNHFGLRLIFDTKKSFLSDPLKRVALVLRNKKDTADQVVLTDTMVKNVMSVFSQAPVTTNDFKFKPRTSTLRGFKVLKDALAYYTTLMPARG